MNKTVKIKDDTLFMGLDSSTQSLKATIVNKNLKVEQEFNILFDEALPEFKTRGGAVRHEDGLTVTSPPLMWVAALDTLLDKMRNGGVSFSRVVAVSGSGQQHGSVFMRAGTSDVLAGMNPEKTLKTQLAGVFALDQSPIWMDSSTTKQCEERDSFLGGPQAVAELTGSRSYERFTGNQIAKIFSQSPEKYNNSERIALVSSFIASIFAGKYAPIDFADGAGMNLMNIRSRQWAEKALECTAPGLAQKLGAIVASHSVIGYISPYFTQKYGFPPHCRIIAFSGDNPNSLAALRLSKPGDMAVSMGTSDTVFGALNEPAPSADEGHIFGSPVDPDGYMALICFKNGSLTREYIRDIAAQGSWGKFEEALKTTAPGNDNRIGFYFREPEITPPILKTGIYRFDANDSQVDAFPDATDIRAVVESRFLSMKIHAANIGLNPTRILATGGASANRSMLQIMADVFGVDVDVSDMPDSASLGAAYRAYHGLLCDVENRFIPFAEAVAHAPSFKTAASPTGEAHTVYQGMLDRYRSLENTMKAKSSAKTEK